MLTITARNVNDAYEKTLNLIAGAHIKQNSRNGAVLRVPELVAIRYNRPCERVLFDAQRDANPFLHLFESLWMLSGQDDVAVPAQFVARFKDYSDDGKTLHGAYGKRWRAYFGNRETVHTGIGEFEEWAGIDQLDMIVGKLLKDPDDRRVVLSMWDANADLTYTGKDAPCNLEATFQIIEGALCMAVFNRSNDAIWGALGANAVHFSMLQEYLASRIGVSVGWYEQVTANLHVYEPVWEKMWPITQANTDPYQRPSTGVYAIPLVNGDALRWEVNNDVIISCVRNPYQVLPPGMDKFFSSVAIPMLGAHIAHKDGGTNHALSIIESAIRNAGPVDWLVSSLMWLQRRRDRQKKS